MNHGRISAARMIAGIAATLAAVLLAVPLSAPAQAATGYKLQTVTLASGKTTVARWNPCQAAITYQVNLAGLPKAKRAAMLALVKKSFAKLAAVDGLTYRYTGTTTFVPMSNNLAAGPAEIVVAAVGRNATDLGLGENSLGYGGTVWSTWYGSNGEGAAVVRGFVVLNPSGMASLKPGFGKGKTQGNVVLHELGHATGLEHVSGKDEQMNPTLMSTAPNGYGAGDRAELKKIGRDAGCITISSAVKVADLS